MLTIKIHFNTFYGQCIKVVGDLKILGEWDPFKGKRLSYQADGLWFIEIPFETTLKSSFDFKFVLCSENEKQETIHILRWEENQNHFFSNSDFDMHCNIETFEYWNYPFVKHVVTMKKLDDKSLVVEKQVQIELPPEVQREHRSISATMKPVLTPQTITVEEKIFTQEQIQKGKAAGDVRAVAIEIIEKELSNSGINFALTNDPSKSNLSSLPFIASSTVQNSTCFQVKISDDNPVKLTYEELQKSPEVKEKFEADFRSQIAEAVDCPLENVIIISISKGSIVVEFLIREINRKNQGRIDEAKQQMQGKLSGTFGKINTAVVELTYRLSLDDFDSRGDFQFGDPNGSVQTRGGLPYYQPNNTYFRKGLKVLDKFPNDGWIDMNGHPNEWAVAFHGISKQVNYAIPKVVNEGLRIGAAQACARHICQRTGLIVGEGVYCTPKIEVAESGYTCEKMDLQGSRYGIIFQCRVKPTAIKFTQSTDYWVINDPKDIRPYGIIFKKV